MPTAQAMPEVSTSAVPFGFSTVPIAQPEMTFAQPEVPVPAVATTSPATANQFPPTLSAPQQFSQSPQQPTQQWGPPREVVVISTEHPFRQYWGAPNDPQAKITGRQMTVAELFSGTRSSAVRTHLLQAYWELSGLLAIYHFRCEAERLAGGATGQQQEMMTLLREQRRTAEVEFIKQQWVLAELLKLYKGQALRESELPIPADYPLYPRYQTHADLIARTERARHLGRMIPIQEQLIETKNGTWRAASEMVPSASQPFFVVSNQRTMAFLDLTKAIVDYNKMIAEYVLETIPPNASQHQLVGAVVRLPRGDAVLEQPQTLQTAVESIRLTQYEAPTGVLAQPVAQVAHEFQTEYQPAPPPIATPPSLLTPAHEEVAEVEETEFVPEIPAFLRDLM